MRAARFILVALTLAVVAGLLSSQRAAAVALEAEGEEILAFVDLFHTETVTLNGVETESEPPPQSELEDRATEYFVGSRWSLADDGAFQFETGPAADVGEPFVVMSGEWSEDRNGRFIAEATAEQRFEGTDETVISIDAVIEVDEDGTTVARVTREASLITAASVQGVEGGISVYSRWEVELALKGAETAPGSDPPPAAGDPSESRSSDEADAAQLVLDLFEAVNAAIVDGSVSAIEPFFAPDYFSHGSADAGLDTGVEGFIGDLESIVEPFPDATFEVQELVVEGDMVAVRYLFTGTPDAEYFDIAPVDEPVQVTGLTFLRIEGGQIAESWGVLDALGLQQQLEELVGPET